MENLNIISVLNLSISAFTGIIVTTYIWKRNNTITKKEKIIKIHFDLIKELEYYSSSYKMHLSNEIYEYILKSIKNIPKQTGLLDDIKNENLFNKIYLSLIENYEFKNIYFINKYNPNYFLRLLTVNLSKKDYNLLRDPLNTIQSIIDKMFFVNLGEIDIDELFTEIREIMANTKNGLLTYSEMINKIKGEISLLEMEVYRTNVINYDIKKIDKEIIDFIVKM